MLLFVCHANLCRSPMAERLAMMALAGRAPALTIGSAGTHARPGLPMHFGAVCALREVGADDSGFLSRPISRPLLEAAGLVLTATRDQRSICAALAPTTMRRTFTLRQFGRLASSVDPGRVSGTDSTIRLSSLVAATVSAREGLRPAAADEDDLADPVGGTEDDMRACVRQIQGSLHPVLALIAES
jgi:protein-tyrosine phosphatase